MKMNKMVMLIRVTPSPMIIAIIHMISSSSAFLKDEFFLCIFLYVKRRRVVSSCVFLETQEDP